MRRTLRAVRLLVRDGGLPRWLRGLAAVGLAPIPGPVDEAVLLAVAAILWLGYRDRLRAAWRAAGERSEGTGIGERQGAEGRRHRERHERDPEQERQS